MKLGIVCACVLLSASHPSRVCGLKPLCGLSAPLALLSHPSRVCGLKRLFVLQRYGLFLVTPLAGVWIETQRSLIYGLSCTVTPLAGVWIETSKFFGGLSVQLVTPLAGVWIETSSLPCRTCLTRSHPSRVCGLKQPIRGTGGVCQQSHPSRVCGLKPFVLYHKDTATIRHTPRGCVD